MKIRNRGFTLIEMMVAVAIFTLVVTAASGLFVAGLRTQRHSLAYQEVADQVSYAAEYISRSARMAKKELSVPPACLSAPGWNYENPGGNTSRLRFIKFDYADDEYVCREFFLEDGRLKEYKKNLATGEESTQPLTSEALHVESLEFLLSGASQEDDKQPLVAMILEVRSAKEETVVLKLQTSISQRDLDIKR